MGSEVTDLLFRPSGLTLLCGVRQITPLLFTFVSSSVSALCGEDEMKCYT